MTTWVLLRGLMRESRHWGDFPHQLQRVIGESDIVCIDFPGNGPLNAQHSLTSVPEMAEHCRQQLQAKGCTGPYHVLAISLGAMVAVAWADAHPDDIKSMTLINTSLAPYNPFYQRLRPQNYPQLLRTLLFGNRRKREALILKLTSNLTTKAAAPSIVDEWVHYAREFPIARANILRQLRAASQFRAPDHAPSTQVLMLASKQDHLVSVKCSQEIAEKWEVELQVHEHAGHDLPLDDSAWVIKMIQEWHTRVL
ncbi:alpha/beta hydrolase [Undibacterium sp. LX40W]|uniref:Alpha/beta hydrolase n=1 Tax=Undibacterium nitidum TaxID=2762298 RepID=A0A923HPH8_9BURK|nr:MULTISPECIES: alpha/beta hydrolase [Undibacterium]MBC3881616.1 alpha/beta hydrolase [Undibacterium nitidum]MBC3891601.1 alpha/beta hydrolase [Undibacterium sp. LX40W]